MSAGHYEQTPIKGAPSGVEKAVTVGRWQPAAAPGKVGIDRVTFCASTFCPGHRASDPVRACPTSSTRGPR